VQTLAIENHNSELINFMQKIRYRYSSSRVRTPKVLQIKSLLEKKWLSTLDTK